MYLNLWSYKAVRHRYSNPMIQPEPEGSTQGYPLVSVEVLRILKDGGEGTCFQLSQRFIAACSYPTNNYKDIMKAQDPHAHSILNYNSIHQSRGSCIAGLFAVIDDAFEEWACSCELTSFWPAAATVEIPASLSVLVVLKPERLKVDRARICEEASKVESCPSEIILDDLLALDSIARFDFE
nr:hypothetical protein [Tanacetum cinerariifolium]